MGGPIFNVDIVEPKKGERLLWNVMVITEQAQESNI